MACSFEVWSGYHVEVQEFGYLPVENQPWPRLMPSLMLEVNLIDCPPAMTGEDFGYLLGKVPVMFLVENHSLR